IATSPSLSQAQPNTSWRLQSRQAHETVWERPEFLTPTAPDKTNIVVVATHRYTELATGLNFIDPATGQWQPSQPAFRLTDQGAIADTTAHKVRLAADISQP